MAHNTDARSLQDLMPAAAVGDTGEPQGVTLRDYLEVLWRRKWIILLVIVVVTASAFFFSARQPKQYEASADLIYEKGLDISNPLTGQTYTDPNERTYEPGHFTRLLVKPGVTGMWQVSGRSALCFEDAVKLDSAYVLECSPLLDLKIMFKTVAVVLQCRGAC